MQRKRIKPYLNYLKEQGFEVNEIRATGGAHFRASVTLNGKTRTTTLPNSPSDRRAFMNWKMDIRKLRRELHAD
jgi:hypothetical protein